MDHTSPSHSIFRLHSGLPCIKNYGCMNFLGQLAFLITISAALATTSSASYDALLLLRQISLSVAILAVCHQIVTKRIYHSQAVAILIYLSAVAWSIFLAYLNDVDSFGLNNIYTDMTVVTLGILLMTGERGQIFPPGIAPVYFAYCLLVLSITIAADGMMLDFPPRFSFEYASEQFGAELDYGQGPSFFFGLASIVSTYLWRNSKSIFTKVPYILSALLFLSLSILGGARGESLIAALMICSLLFATAPKYTAATLITVLLASITLLSDLDLFEDLTFVARMLAVADGNYGLRDELSAQAISLLIRDPWCAISGCGPGYFQFAQGYDFSLYPHNIVFEGLLIFGIPIALIVLLAAIIGAKTYWRVNGKKMDLFLLMFVYHAAVAMKSGYFFGSWFTLIGMLIFISIAFDRNRRASCNK